MALDHYVMQVSFVAKKEVTTWFNDDRNVRISNIRMYKLVYPRSAPYQIFSYFLQRVSDKL